VFCACKASAVPLEQCLQPLMNGTEILILKTEKFEQSESMDFHKKLKTKVITT
jgi:hypothetical protein